MIYRFVYILCSRPQIRFHRVLSTEVIVHERPCILTPLVGCCENEMDASKKEKARQYIESEIGVVKYLMSQ